MNTDEMTTIVNSESNANETEIITGSSDTGTSDPREDGTSGDGSDLTDGNSDDDGNESGVGNPGTDDPDSDDNNPAGNETEENGSDNSDDSHGEDNENGPGESAGSRLPMISMVMSACVSLINGETPEEELSSLLDALRAHERIERLLQQIAETESRCKEEVEALREEMEIKVREAYAAGEIAGRNAVITETLTSAEMTDTIPRLGGSPAPCMHQPNSIFDLAARAR